MCSSIHIKNRTLACTLLCSVITFTWFTLANKYWHWFQSIFSYTGSGFPKPAQQIKAALNSWWNRVKQVGMTDRENRYTNQALFTFSNVSRLYGSSITGSRLNISPLQMVLAKTTEIGCAHKVCNNNRMTVFCLYNEMWVNIKFFKSRENLLEDYLAVKSYSNT